MSSPTAPFCESGPADDTLGHLRDAVEWGVAQSLRGLTELAGLYGANRKRRAEKGPAQSDLAAEHLDLVSAVCRVAGSGGHSASTGDLTAEREEVGALCIGMHSVSYSLTLSVRVAQVNGLVARLVSGFLCHRAALQATSNLFFNSDSQPNSPSSSFSSFLPSALEYIESPLQQMTRAGLGLLSAGLGR